MSSAVGSVRFKGARTIRYAKANSPDEIVRVCFGEISRFFEAARIPPEVQARVVELLDSEVQDSLLKSALSWERVGDDE